MELGRRLRQTNSSIRDLAFETLEKLHAKGVAHGDLIDPSNILWVNGIVAFVNFGQSTFRDLDDDWDSKCQEDFDALEEVLSELPYHGFSEGLTSPRERNLKASDIEAPEEGERLMFV